jgi:hypothetical protein
VHARHRVTVDAAQRLPVEGDRRGRIDPGCR